MPSSNPKVPLLSAHQPVYLPWLGLFHKIAVADLFVLFDAVPYSKKMWYNRNRIRSANGEVMLSVPVFSKGSATVLHKDVRINNDTNWAYKHWRTIELSYNKTRFFDLYAGQLKAIYDQEWIFLSDLNLAILRLIMTWLDIKTPIIKASDYDFRGQKSDLVLDMCIKLNAEAYLFGSQGKDYADIASFLARGVAPLFQDYNHPVYTQARNEFSPFMSVIDLLFNYGEDSKNIVMSSNQTRDCYLQEAEQLRLSI